MAWDKSQVRSFVKRAKDRAGNGWGLLGADIQEALIAVEFARVVSSQSSESMRSESVSDLWHAMRAEVSRA